MADALVITVLVSAALLQPGYSDLLYPYQSAAARLYSLYRRAMSAAMHTENFSPVKNTPLHTNTTIAPL